MVWSKLHGTKTEKIIIVFNWRYCFKDSSGLHIVWKQAASRMRDTMKPEMLLPMKVEGWGGLALGCWWGILRNEADKE